MTDSTTAEIGWFVQEYETLQAALNGAKGSRLDMLRRHGLQAFQQQGLPKPKDEKWKYTNVRPFLSRSFFRPEGLPPAEAIKQRIAELQIPDLGARQVVFVDGRLLPEASDSLTDVAGLRSASIGALIHERSDPELVELFEATVGTCADADKNPFVALNAALLEDGLFLRIDGAVQAPLHLVFLNSGAEGVASLPRVVVSAAENSAVFVVETHAALSTAAQLYFSSPVTEIVADAGARVEHAKLILEAGAAVHIGKTSSRIAASASVKTFVFNSGGRLIRNEVDPVLEGEGAEAVLNGLTVIDQEQHVDNDTVIDHAVPRCESHELYKGIYRDKARGVFSGTIIVRPDAQKTNAIQYNQSLLLSDEASIESKPQLMIWADDVKCTHGATVGQLDDDALFYLRSRGIDREEATSLLIQAFAGDVAKEIGQESLRRHVTNLLAERLAS